MKNNCEKRGNRNNLGCNYTQNDSCPGLLLVVAIAVPAWFAGKMIPLIGGPVFGILFRHAAGLLAKTGRCILMPGIKFSAKKILQASIILLGFEMNLHQVFAVGSQSLSIMVFTLSAAFLTAWGGRTLFEPRRQDWHPHRRGYRHLRRIRHCRHRAGHLGQ
jgi:uncharacterized membrane protein YadS